MANHNTPPLYAPTAVATSLGWVNPQTGEILVSHKGLEVENIINLHGIPRRDFVKVIERAQEDLAKKEAKKEPKKDKEPEKVETPVIKETEAPVKEGVEKEKAPAKTATKKASTTKKATTKKSTKTAE